MPDQILVPGGITFVGKDRSVLYVDAFYIDVRPITFSQYAEFLKATGRPADDVAWQKTGILRRSFQPRTGNWEAPVTHISLEEAEAYAAWAGKRLPTFMEWMRASMGRDERGWLDGPEHAVDMAWIEYLEGGANRSRRMERLIGDYVPVNGRPVIELDATLGEWVSGSWHSAVNDIVRRMRITWVRPYSELSQGTAVVVRHPQQADIVDSATRVTDVTFRCAADAEHQN